MKAKAGNDLDHRGSVKAILHDLCVASCFILAVMGYAPAAFGGESVGYGYDERGRLARAAYGSGHFYHYLYDAAGNITGIEQAGEADRDGDLLPDRLERTGSCPDIDDADSDDDGIPDGWEDRNQNGIVDPGETDPCNPDTDGDGIPDGMELGVVAPVPDPDGAGPLKGTDTGLFQPDADPAAKTNPLAKDSDGDGIPDGVEDANRNGRLDAGEGNPFLVQARSLSGTLYGTGGSPLAGTATVKAYSGTSCGDLQLEASTRSQAGTGVYALDNLTRGRYYILAEPSGTGSLPQWYAGAGQAFDCTQAQAVSLAETPEATGLDIRLSAAASLSGTVLESGGNVPSSVSIIFVKVYSGDACTGALAKMAPLDPDSGRFSVQGLSTGTYYVQADAGSSGYQSGWWTTGGDALSCAGAEAVAVAPGADVQGIDIRIGQGGGIAGRIYQSNGTTAVTGETVIVEAYADPACTGSPAAQAFTDEATGDYAIVGLKPGSYSLKAKPLSGLYVDEWWSAAGNAFNCLQAGSVAVAAPDVTAGRDFRLDPGGTISGTLYRSDGVTPATAPLIVEFYLYQGSATRACGVPLVTYTHPAEDGSFRQALPAGTYYIRVNPTGTDYAFAWWTATGGIVSCEDATNVSVQAGAAATGRDFKLQAGRSISGSVYQADGVTPVASPIQVIACSDNPCDRREVARGVYTPETGRYTIASLGSGSYTVLVNASGTTYADEWWSAEGNAHACFRAAPLQLADQDLTGKEILLDIGARIAGTIYKKDGVTPIGQTVSVVLYPGNSCNSSNSVATAASDPVTGQYAFDRQGPGDYALLADLDSSNAYLDEWWSQTGDIFTCPSAEVFSLAAGVDQTDKDFRLDTKSILSGTLYRPDGSPMNVSFSVHLYPAGACGGTPVASVTSNRTTGKFTFSNLPPGRYRLLVYTAYNVYAAEWYSSAGDAFSCAQASEITVPSGENVANLDVRLNEGAKISGTLYNEEGTAAIPESTTLRLYRGDPCNPESVTTVSSSGGVFEIDALPPGTYYLMTSMSYYYDRWWSQAMNAQGCRDAQPIVIAGIGDIVPATDFRLKAKGSISGKVYQQDGATPVTGTMRVYLYKTFPPCNVNSGGYATVSADGSYILKGLDAGAYAVRAYYLSSDFIAEWWSPGGDAYYCTEAGAITLADGQQATGVDFSLHAKGRIAGRLLKNDGSPIASETMYVYAYAGESACTAAYRKYVTAGAADGNYIIPGLDPGTYFLRTESGSLPNSSFVPEWWSAEGHAYGCAQAQAVTVAMDETAADKDFGLYDCSNFPGKAPNDHFAHSAELTGQSGTLATNNFCATAEGGEPDHPGNGGGAISSLWWRWTAPADGPFIFKTENSSFDTVLAVYTGGAVDALTLVGKNDNAGTNGWSRLPFEARQGQAYSIAVDTMDGSRGLITLAYQKDQVLPGDVNGDDAVDLRDAILALQVVIRGSAAGAEKGADVDADGRIGMAEAIYILQTLAQER